MMPPLITVGSRPPASRSVATREVVVVLPWVPATATQDLKRISSASISARRTTGRRRSRAVAGPGVAGRLAGDGELGVVAADRGRDDDDLGAVDVLGLVADEGLDAFLSQALDVVVVGCVRALDRIAEVRHHLGDARHADAADADEVDGAELGRQLHCGLVVGNRRGAGGNAVALTQASRACL